MFLTVNGALVLFCFIELQDTEMENDVRCNRFSHRTRPLVGPTLASGHTLWLPS